MNFVRKIQRKKNSPKKIPRIKIFNDTKDRENFIKASTSNSFLENVFSEKTKKIEEEIFSFCHLEHGIGIINEDFNSVVDVPLLMDNFFHQFKNGNILVEKNFEIDKIRNIDDGDYKFSYQDGDSEILCKNIIFCEGYLGYKNPYFDDLSWRLVKGRSLVVKFNNENLLPDILKSRNCVLNFHHNLFKISETENIYEFGSTYEPIEIKSIDTIINKENKQKDNEKNEKLIENLKKSIKENNDFEVLYVKEGIRPCSIDMVNPFVGKSLKQNNIYILNGFGSKSFSIGPYLSNNLASHLIFGKDIHPNADTIRFMGN